MKSIKLTLCLLLIAVSSSAMAQNRMYTPIQGDWSIGFGANPVVNFVGNMFNGTTSQSLDELGGSVITPTYESSTYPIMPTVSLMGKYLLTDQLAVRANLGLISHKTNDFTYVQDDLAVALDPLSEALVTDKVSTLRSGASLSAGMEYRVGYGVLQGVFSANLLYAYSTERTNYTYGNQITDINQTPTINGSYTGVTSSMPNARVTKTYTDGVNSLGLMLTAGVEWFWAKHIAMGLEVNLVAVQRWTKQTYADYEGFNTFNNGVENYTKLVSPSDNSFLFGTQNIGANLYFAFYFNR